MGKTMCVKSKNRLNSNLSQWHYKGYYVFMFIFMSLTKWCKKVSYEKGHKWINGAYGRTDH